MISKTRYFTFMFGTNGANWYRVDTFYVPGIVLGIITYIVYPLSVGFSMSKNWVI